MSTPVEFPVRAAARTCPVCGKPTDPALRPFCSKRCADVDLNRWLSDVYAVPVTEDEERPGEDDRESRER